MDEIDGRRVLEEFVDPRNTQSYLDHLSVFGKVMALKTFEHKFVALFRAPMALISWSVINDGSWIYFGYCWIQSMKILDPPMCSGETCCR